MRSKPVCLTIAGLDPSGGAGIIADVKSFSAFGCVAAAAVSSITFQNTTGVFGKVDQSSEAIRSQVEAVLNDLDVSAIKTGMLPTREVIAETARLISETRIGNIVVDPVVRSTSGFDLIDDDALRSLIEHLFPLALVITPNLPEAERICGVGIMSENDLRKAGESMIAMGAKNVLIKGGHADETVIGNRQAKAVDLLFGENGVQRFEKDRIATDGIHGTGCSLSAAIAANLALGKSVPEAIGIAKDFVFEGIRTAEKIGRGHRPVNISPIWPKE
ncbi:MAG: bifunctional hydroxymethylpyrimidine kinase/phosphomethylpyrimidine kinase [Pyrinomonadaceae bacterium]